MDATAISFPIFGEGFVINAPRYISIFGFRLYLYGLFITAGFGLAALYLLKRHQVVGLTKDNVLDLVIMAVPCGLIGARLYYIIFNLVNTLDLENGIISLCFAKAGLPSTVV